MNNFLAKKTICIFSSFLHPHLGGVERYVDNLAQGLEKRGYHIILIGLNTEKAENCTRQGNITVLRLPCFLALNGRFPLVKFNSEFLDLFKILNTHKIDFIIINVRFYILSLLAAFFSKSKKIPAILIEHGTGHFTLNNLALTRVASLYEHLITAILKTTNLKFFGVSQASAIWLKHFGISATGVIYNGINSKERAIEKGLYHKVLNLNSNDIIVSFAGRFIKEKGIVELLSAFSYLTKSNKGIVLIVAGDGPLFKELSKKYEKTSNIFFLGKISSDEVICLLQESDILVLPTIFPEGLPTILLEAGTQKCAIITTAMGGTREVIPNENFGLIIADNTPNSIIQAVETLIKAPKERLLMSDNLHNRIVEIFDWNVIIDKLEREILNDHLS
jgi:glycosyltransferase involved in cell wall biosynthesis